MQLLADSAELEGYNSLLKVIGKRAPHISLELLDARVRLKKAMTYGLEKAINPKTGYKLWKLISVLYVSK